MKISLKDGSIKTSRQGSGSILISPNDPFLQVSDGVNNLMYMGTNNYYLQSSNYSGTTQQYCIYNGTKYLIYSDKNNKLYATNGMNIYSISGGEVDNETGQMIGMSLAAYNPSYKKDTITGGSDNSLPSASKEEITGDEAKKIFLTEIIPVLTQIKPKGLHVDLNNGIILGYDLYLKGTSSTNSDSKFFILDSGAPEYPFQVGNKFKLNWDGTLTCYKINELSNTGSPTGYAININDHFYIDQNGNGSGSGFHAGTSGYAGSAGSAKTAEIATFLNNSGTLVHASALLEGIDNAYAKATTAAVNASAAKYAADSASDAASRALTTASNALSVAYQALGAVGG